MSLPFNNVARRKGFTLIEIMLVIALIAILATAIIVALNPKRQISQANDTTRTSHVNAILNAISQYTLENQGEHPDITLSDLPCSSSADNEICQTDSPCATGIDLSPLTDDERYMVSIPIDPQCQSEEGTCYYISQSVNGRITVCAPNTETTEEITATM